VPREWGLAKKWGGETGELNSSSTSEREMRWRREDLEISVAVVSNHILSISFSLSYFIIMFYYI
jgi:hypothetical protein